MSSPNLNVCLKREKDIGQKSLVDVRPSKLRNPEWRPSWPRGECLSFGSVLIIPDCLLVNVVIQGGCDLNLLLDSRGWQVESPGGGGVSLLHSGLGLIADVIIGGVEVALLGVADADLVELLADLDDLLAPVPRPRCPAGLC